MILKPHIAPMTKKICLPLIVVLAAVLYSSAQEVEDVSLVSKKEGAREAALKRPERLTVIAPKHLRPRSDYHVLVNLENSEQPVAVDITLTGARDSDREQIEAKSLLANSGETQTIKFNISDWPTAEYILSVNAQAVDRSWNFTDEHILNYYAKSYSTFIQTDKAVYKPGQLVQFRAIFLTENFTPLSLRDGEINVTVSDPRRNIIKQWSSLSNYRGLLSLDMQLSEDPMLGDYSIRVEARDQEATKRFRVAEYILPTFDVNIRLPNYATYNDSDIVATVDASYTYGRPVNGHVTLTVQPLVRFRYLDTQPLEQAQFRSRLTNGTADIALDLVKDLKQSRNEFFEREIEFFALVEEDLTGRKYNKTQVMKIYSKNIKIEPIKYKKNFKPGLSYLTQLKVAYQDDIPVEDNGPELELRYKTQGNTFERVKLRPVAGIVEHQLQVPKKIKSPKSRDEMVVLEYIEVEVTYRGQEYNVFSITVQSSLNDQYIQLSLPELAQRWAAGDDGSGHSKRRKTSPAVSVNDELKVRVKATEPMQQITCQGIARGNIIWAISPDAKNQTELEFEVKVDQKLAPEATILCFCIRPEGKEIIADSIRFPVNGLTRTLVKLSTSRDEAEPGQEVEVGVFTKPNSLVGILGIDQSVLLLRSGNDITQEDLANEIKSYASRGIREDDWSGYISTAKAVFDDADVIVLTNNLLYPGRWYHRNYKVASVMRLHSSLVSVQAAPQNSEIALDTLILDREIYPREHHLEKPKNEQLVIRKKFPETWLWENATAGLDGTVSFKSKMPDTITSWVLSAFSLNENAGFGLSTTRTSVRVFRPFFIKLNLPYSIIRGETVSIQAIVFNYSKRPTAAKVILDNSNGEFEFLEAANNIEDEKRVAKSSESRLIRIPAEDGVSVSFLITPRKLGHIDIRMTAQSEFAGDGLVQKLLVKPEGQTQHLNKAFLIKLAAPSSAMDRNVTIDVPANAVAGSQKVFVSAIGDIMGPGLSNVDDLLRLPYGCGEQNMINLVPNIVILNYLQHTKRLREAQRAKAKRNIEAGYQREMNYKRRDGSFSAFGETDKNGSVWLTAYVLKTLQQAKDIVTVDEKVVRRAANFIASHSRPDGSIEEAGMVHNKQLQSQNSGASTYLTAYSMIALLQKPILPDSDAPAPVALVEVLEKGLDYLERQLDKAAGNDENPYELAIIAYTLQLANRKPEIASRAYEQLWTKAQEDRDMIWWESKRQHQPGDGNSQPLDSVGNSESLEREFESIGKSTTTSTVPPLKPSPVAKKHSAHLFVPESLDIEMTSLALLVTVKRGELDRALPIVKWLIGQQNSVGGFASTQDTVLAIEALAAFAQASVASLPAPSIDVELTYPRNHKSDIRRTSADQLTISRSNALLNQQIRLPDNLTWVQVNASGSGVAVLQVSWQYNLLVSAEQPAFYLNPIIDRSSNINYLQLSVCTFYKAGESSNMALMEVELPSGYTADVEALPGLRQTKNIMRIDTAQGDTKVLIYLDRVTRDEICLTVPAHRTSKVSNNKPVPVSIYDYYNRQHAARIFYEPHSASSCDICDSDTCNESCSKKPKRSARLVSLHEQRKLAATSGHRHDGLANLTAPANSGVLSQSPGAADNYSILPLAPVLVTLVAAARNLYP